MGTAVHACLAIHVLTITFANTHNLTHTHPLTYWPISSLTLSLFICTIWYIYILIDNEAEIWFDTLQNLQQHVPCAIIQGNSVN